jgi:hypothetical protein
MSPQTLRDLAEDKEVYIGLLAAGGYEYTVGFIAIVALGAAVVPMGKFAINQPKGQEPELNQNSCGIAR